MRNPRAVIALLVICMLSAIMATVVTSEEPASAGHANRNRSGIQEWAPDFIGFSNTDSGNTTQVLKWRFKWKYGLSMPELETGSSRGFEVKARVDSNFADDYWGSGNLWHNLPSATNPYVDTMLSDPPSSGSTTFGVGAMPAHPVSPGVEYFASVVVDTGSQNATKHGFIVDFVVMSNLYHWWIPQCAGQLCYFSDYVLRYFNEIDYESANNSSFSKNQFLHLWGNFFMDLNAGGWSFSSSANLSGLTGQGQLKLAGQSSLPTAWADVGYGAHHTDNFSVSVMVRCPSWSGVDNCRGEVGYKTTNGYSMIGGSPENDTLIDIPDDNQWYTCRVDWDHGGQPKWPQLGSSDVRVFFRNFRSSGQPMYFDVVRLGGYTNNITGTTGDPFSPASSGSDCTRLSDND